MKKVVLGLSGGVDSAVAAHILRARGYDVHGAFLDLFDAGEREDAITSARENGIPLTIMPAREDLLNLAALPFRESRVSGRTLNPCVICNPNVKLKLLLKCADSIGADYIATGHYCRCDFEHIYMGKKDFDQSYMFCRTPKELLKRLILPLGDMTKQRVREIALKNGISVFSKPDSRDSCFFGGLTCEEWIESTGEVPSEGNVIYSGEVIGRHGGIHKYTAGQKYGEISGKRLYVKRIEGNDIILSDWEGQFEDEIVLTDLMDFSCPGDDFRAVLRARHTRREMPLCSVKISGGKAYIRADSPLRAPCPGQQAALYVDERLAMSGIIE